MIEANELRLTNLVLFNKMVLSFDRINKHKSFLKQEKTGLLFECSISELQPIPLTREILLKCGAQLDEEDDSYVFIESGFYVSVNDKSEAILFYKNEELCEFNYLHQLQNLYFALTNEELKIKN
jgi:hypothetical protein